MQNLEIPKFDEDLFASEALRDPFELYRQIRDLGPFVYLTRASVYAISRFHDVRAALYRVLQAFVWVDLNWIRIQLRTRAARA
jgi:cytochrome P450